MRRRLIIQAAVAIPIMGVVRVVTGETKMITVTAGPWSFDVPPDWRPRERPGTAPYLEAADRAKGCYIKAVTFPQPRPSSEDAAAFLQDGHERAFMADPKANWKVVERSRSVSGTNAKSILDLLDEGRSYRILSVVIANTRVAIQLTLHDYNCKDYDASMQAFAPIVQSLRGPANGA